MSELGMSFAASIVGQARALVIEGALSTEDAAIGIANALAILLAHEPSPAQRAILADGLVGSVRKLSLVFADDPVFRAKAASDDPHSFDRREL